MMVAGTVDEAKSITYTYDKAGRRTGMNLHDGVTDVAFAYDNRDRCNDIDLEGAQLATYQWLANSIHLRTITSSYPGSTKPTFEMHVEHDGLMRVEEIDNQQGTPDMERSGASMRLGGWSYLYDAAGNPTVVQHDHSCHLSVENRPRVIESKPASGC